ncbi:MAG: MipA/OmpV family protein [Pseudobdellovibrionaceae bacterium]
MKFRICLFVLFFSFVFLSQAQAENSQEKSLWEYGVGAGFARISDYPASDESRDFFFPFPTFQYRGDILRADDREGARAYLLRSAKHSIEIGGSGFVALKSDDNEARKGMEDLPWNLQLGPQWVYRPMDDFEFKWGIYRSILANERMTRLGGWVSEMQGIWHVDQWLQNSGAFGISTMQGRFSLTLKGGDQDFHALYFDVSEKDVTLARTFYESREGFLSATFSYYQSASFRRWSIYTGVADSHYQYSANRESPLHKADRNFSFFAGVTYRLSESESKSVPVESPGGILKRFQPN